MDTIASAMGQGGGAGAGGDAADPTGGAAGYGSDAASKLRLGGSAISALSNFGLAMSKATSLSTQADQERLQASDDYVQASEKSNAIAAQYQQVVGAQLTTAAAGGVDVGSGSVQNAQRQAQLVADSESRKARLGAQLDASQRMARFYALKQASGVQRTVGFLNLAQDAMNTAASAVSGGAPGG